MKGKKSKMMRRIEETHRQPLESQVRPRAG